MRIRMLTGLSGPEYSLGPGDERDFPQDEALRFIAAGYAVPVAGQQIERAVLSPPAETRPVEPNTTAAAEMPSAAVELPPKSAPPQKRGKGKKGKRR